MRARSFRGVAGAMLLLIGTAAWAQETPDAKQQRQVRELLVLMRAGDMGLQMVDGMIGNMKQLLPGAPDEFWTKFRQKIKGSDLIDLLVPVYAKNLDAADVEALIQFYRSPTGQRFIEKQPIILQESMVVGQKWGEQLAAQAIKELQATQQPR